RRQKSLLALTQQQQLLVLAFFLPIFLELRTAWYHGLSVHLTDIVRYPVNLKYTLTTVRNEA
ncbi:MAG TPA: hypothetical protein V6D43_14435, partial [Candidatus Sericytochromatia bacterium]